MLQLTSTASQHVVPHTFLAPGICGLLTVQYTPYNMLKGCKVCHRYAHVCSGLVTYHKAGLVQVFEWYRLRVKLYQNPSGGDSSSC